MRNSYMVNVAKGNWFSELTLGFVTLLGNINTRKTEAIEICITI
jgi:hypothetical protein